MQFRVTREAELYEAPKRSARVVARLPTGTVVDRVGRRERHWLPVRHQSISGWVPERHIEKIDESSSPNGRRARTEEEIVAIIREAARAFAQPEEDLLRVGRCESNLDPNAVNPDGPYLGLFQFLRSTWASTPFAHRDIFDPVANAQAAAWMWQQGRRGEWACQ
jgi:hypothetical protein